MAMIVTVEAQAWMDGCIADCDLRRCEDHATMVIEFGPEGFRVRSARCTAHSACDAPVGSGDAAVERVLSPLRGA